MTLRPRFFTPARAGLLAAAVFAATSAVAQTPATRTFDIPAAPLDEALARFGADTGTMIVVDADLTANRRSPGLQGTHSIDAGLVRLLAGTGLEARFNDGRYVLRAVPGAGATGSAAEAVTLATVNVAGDVGGPIVTEGTNSYAPPRASRSATGLALSVRDTPQSITVVSRQRLDDMGTSKLADVMAQTTGILVQETDSERITFTSRGYAINNFQVDGVLATFGSVGGKNTDMAAYDRVEIIRGATGLTTGAGDPSGTVNLIRKRPTAELAGNASLVVGSWNTRRVEADLGGPLALDGRVRGRLVVADDSRESFRDRYEMKRKVAYGVIEADLTDTTLLTAGYEYQKQTPTAPTWGTVLYWGWDPVAKQSYEINASRSQNLSANWGTWAPTDGTAFATLEQKLGGDWTLKGTYSHSDRSVDTDVWFGFGGAPRPDGTGVNAAAMNSRFEETMRVADINASGSFTLLGRRHDVNLGYTHNERRGESEAALTGTMPADWLTLADWRNFNGQVAPRPMTYLGRPSSVTKLTQGAAYAATRLRLSDPLSTVLGARYSSWRTRTTNYGSDGLGTPTNSGYSPDKVFTPYAGVLYDVSPNTTVYASYTDIFRPQDMRDKNDNYLDPVVGSNYEIGLKSEWLDGDMLLAAAMFRSKQDNVGEVDDSVPPNSLPGGVTAYRSTGEGNRVAGWEVEATGRLTPAWNVSAGISRTESKNALGERINTTQPMNLMRVFTTYKLPGALDKMTVGGGITWQSSIFRNGNRPVAERPNGTLVTESTRMNQSSFYLVNLMASYEINRNFTAALNVNNLFDKHYYRNVGFYSGVHWGEPRSVQLTLRGKF